MAGALLAAYRAPSASLAFRVTAGGSTQTVTATVTSSREYWLAGDGRADTVSGDGDLLALLQAALLSHTAVTTCSVTLVAGRIRITADVAISILWTDPLTTAEAWVWGWDGTTNSDSGTTVDAPLTCPLVWLANEDVAQDSRDRDVLLRGSRQSLSGRVYTTDFGDGAKRRELTFELIPNRLALEEYAGTVHTAFETILRRAVSKGRRVRVYEDLTTIPTGVGFASYRCIETPTLERNSQWEYTYDVSIQARADGLDTTTAEALTWTPQAGAYVRVSPGNYLSIVNPATLDGRTALTIAFWLRNSDAVATRGALLARSGQWAIEERAPQFQAFIIGTSGHSGPNNAAADDGQWHLWTWVYSAGTLSVFVDGAQLAGSFNLGVPPAALSSVIADLTLGHTAPSATAESHDLARLAIWGAAASPTQIAELFAARTDLGDGAGLALGAPLIWAPLDGTQVGGTVGGTIAVIGNPSFEAGS